VLGSFAWRGVGIKRGEVEGGKGGGNKRGEVREDGAIF